MGAPARNPVPDPPPQEAGPVLRPVPAEPAEPAESPAPARERAAWPALAAHLRHLRPPDVWDTPAPTVRAELARALEGTHLPETGWLRRAEAARALVSAGVIALLLVLVHVNRSAARQGVALLIVIVIAVAWSVAI